MNVKGSERPPKVSIVIPVRNKLELTRKCLESIAAHDPLVNYEIILIDNASEDGSKEFFEEKTIRKEISFIRNDSPMHFALSCNQGAAMASGDYLVFLNNDTEAFPGWLDAMVEVGERDKNIGAVGAKLLYPDRTIQHAGVAFFKSDFTNMTYPLHLFKDFPKTSPAVSEEREFQVVTGACLLTPRRLFNDFGGFDTVFINCFEDVDYCLRLRERGYKVIYTPKAELIHYEGQTPGRNDNVRQAGVYLQGKWAGKLNADAVDFLRAEGFYIYEYEAGLLTVCFGPAMMKWWELIKQLIDLGQHQIALQELETMRRHAPGTAELYVLIGRCLVALNRNDEAREAFRKVAEYKQKTAERDKLDILVDAGDNNLSHTEVSLPAL
jgi:GT2 family glycosyltransferase